MQSVPDWLPALVNAARAFAVIAVVELFWVVTAWPNVTAVACPAGAPPARPQLARPAPRRARAFAAASGGVGGAHLRAARRHAGRGRAIAARDCWRLSAAAETIGFEPSPEKAGWRSAAMPGLRPARFSLGPEGALEISAESAVGWLWRPVSRPTSSAKQAQWSWLVVERVVATDLSQRGSDDRAIALYFVFSQEKDAAQNPLAQLTSGSAHALVYVFGGKHARGSVVTSPHLQSRGRFIVLRPADSSRHLWFSESVNLSDDYARVFNSPKPPLVAVAVSSDSHDTRNLARVRELSLAP